MPLFSIIIPVYNAQRYLHECVDSIIRQSYADWELLLVNDRSSDGSSTICDMYTENDSRIKVIHLTENLGAAGARSAGITASSGDYIIFLDSDDFFEEGSLYALASYISSNPDKHVIFLAFCFYQASKNRRYRNIIPDVKALSVMSNEDFILKIVQDGCCIPQVGVKAIQAQFVRNNDLYFKQGVYICEDVDWTHRILSTNARWGACDHPHYVYRIRKGSLSHSRDGLIKWSTSVYKTFALWATYLEDEHAVNRETGLCFLARSYGIALALYPNLEPEMLPEAKALLKRYSWVLKYSDDIRTKLVRTAYKIIGFQNTTFLTFQYMKLRQMTKRD